MPILFPTLTSSYTVCRPKTKRIMKPTLCTTCIDLEALGASKCMHVVHSVGFRAAYLTSPTFLAMYVGQRLCINSSVSRAKFLINLHLHLDVTCSCYFLSSFFHIYIYSLSLKNIVNYIYFGISSLVIFKTLGDNWVDSVLDPHVRRKVHIILKMFGYRRRK